MTSSPAVWITRARPGADRTAARLTQAGHTPLVRPLTAIEPLIVPAPPEGFDALAFTSANGVSAWLAVAPETSRTLPVFCVGAATARRAREAGFAEVTSAEGDVADLAALIRSALGAGRLPDRTRLLHPAAEAQAGDLAGALAGHVEVRTLAVYRATSIPALVPADFAAVLIHSPRGGRELASRLTPDQAAGRIAVALSQASAAPLTDLPFAHIAVAAAPNEAALLQALNAALGKPPGGV